MQCFDRFWALIISKKINPFHNHGYFTLAGKKKIPTIALTYTKKPINLKSHSGDAGHGTGCRKWQQNSLGGHMFSRSSGMLLHCLATDDRLRS